MIVVDCTDVLPILHDLLVHVADHVEAFSAIKHNEFLLSPIELADEIDKEQVTKTIEAYLDSIGVGSDFTVIDSLPKKF